MPCAYLRTVTSTVAVDTSWNSRYGYVNCFHENLGCKPKSDFNLIEPIRKTYFSPAENIDVLDRYNYATIRFFWSIGL